MRSFFCFSILATPHDFDFADKSFPLISHSSNCFKIYIGYLILRLKALGQDLRFSFKEFYLFFFITVSGHFYHPDIFLLYFNMNFNSEIKNIFIIEEVYYNQISVLHFKKSVSGH